MDFSLTAEDQDLKALARDFCDKRLYPQAIEFDEHEKLPDELIKETASLGYFGCLVDEGYGGLGLSTVSFMGMLEEFAAASAAFGLMVSLHNSLVCQIIKEYGSDLTKKKYLPLLAKGDLIGAYCLTEEEAGTDASSLVTEAEQQGDSFVISGTKWYVTSANFAGLYIVFAKTDPDKGRKGISCFAVDAKSPGITLSAPMNTSGLKASDTRNVTFTNVKVPAENLLGTRGDGLKMALSILNSGRIGVAFQSIGIAQAAYEEALKYSQVRKQFGKSISEFQAIQFKLAEMLTRIEAGRLLAYRAAFAKDAGQPFHREASMAKLFCSRAANYVCNEAVQIHGGYGYIKEYAVERYYRDARGTEIFEGTNEAQLLTISRDVLKG
jgi:alkylation response protein AidB-like acyl-CoA dehydrogenase